MIANMQMTYNHWATRFWVPLFLSAVLLAVPMSATAKSIFLGLAVGFIVFAPAYWQDLRATMSQLWCQAALVLFFIALVGCVWSPATFKEQMLVLEKYSKLLYLPILAVGFRDSRTRKLGVHAFLIAMLITCFLSILKFTGVIKYHGIDPGHVFRNHIMTGYMMSFAAYLSALLFVRAPGKMRIVYGSLALLFSFQVLFINTGRTGYLIYLLLMALLFIQTLTWRQALTGVLLGSLLLTSAYFLNSTIHSQVGQAVTEWRHYQENKNTSVGYRLQFHEYANTLFKRHPWIGNGTGSFTYLYRVEQPISSWNWRLLEPHSQYWLIAAEFGLLGLLALGFFFASLLMTAFKLKSMRAVAIAVLLPFLVGNLSDSLLFYSGTGYCFIIFMALCLGERIGVRRSSIL